MSLPKNWPPETKYISAPFLSPTLSKEARTSLLTRSKESREIPASTPRGPSHTVHIKPINLPSHPANGQRGLFANKALKPGEFIIQYLGVYHCSTADPSTDPHAHSDYDLSLDRELKMGIDADKTGNEARFVNDYRGVAERPNAEFMEIWDPRRKERGIGVWVLGTGKSGNNGFKGIKKGEEILISYGKGFWGARSGGDS
ncbi:SET-containing protein [Coleophoma cylindrospora]|uniref:SET-containing protein n=1 Tax=Coleophoma cylindrospora TaxID=1849047 RepID=A0A3D8RLZ6_9HELO|nr:SET-containing protein [Coleophoma cylindrospora]